MTHRKKVLGGLLKIRLFGWQVIAFFCLAPLLFLQLIDVMSEENVGAKEIDHFIQDGVILFVMCAIAGTVVFDFITARFSVKGWLPFFAVYISPFCILSYLFLKYLLKYVQLGDQHDFGPGALTTRLAVGFLIIYCIAVKTIYYIKQEDAGNNFNLQYHS